MTKQNIRYFFLKIGAGNSLASAWLGGKNDLGCPAAVIFFDTLAQPEYETAARSGLKPDEIASQAFDFYRCGLVENWPTTRMVVIYGSKLCLLRPKGPVQFLTPKPEESSGQILTRKAMPVETMVDQPLCNVPAVLAGLPADQYLSRGTFRPIGHWGNLKAIDMVLHQFAGIEPDWESDHWDVKQQTAAQLLECIGSTGLETLVARILEDAGCFVPARTGGVLRDIDLFAHNDTKTDIRIGGGLCGTMVIPAGESISVQVKTWPTGKDRFKAGTVNYLVGLDVAGASAFDADWLLAAAIQCDGVREWLSRSLGWLPQGFREQFGLQTRPRNS
jgi:hypothetical protein